MLGNWLMNLRKRISGGLTSLFGGRRSGPGVSEAADALPMDCIIFLTDIDVRMNGPDFKAFLVAFLHRQEQFLKRLSERPARYGTLQLACALLPGKQILLDSQSLPANAVRPGDDIELTRWLNELPLPHVKAPVAFMIRGMIGDQPDTDADFQFPFRHELPQGTGGTLEERLSELAAARGSGDATRWTIDDFSRLIELDPENAPAYCGRAALHAADGRVDESLADFDRAIALQSHDPDIFAERADVRAEFDDFEGALADYARALELFPKHVWSRYNRAMLYGRLNETQKSLEDLDQGINDAPENPQLYMIRGLVRASVHDFDGATADFTATIGLLNDYAPAYLERARVALQRQEVPPALEDLAAAIAHAPESGVACGLRAAVLADEGRMDEAFADLSLALEREPENPDYRVQRAQLYLAQGKNALAIEELEIVRTAHPEAAAAWAFSGIAHQQLDDYPEAILECTRAIELGMAVPGVLFSRAVACHFTGEVQRALEDLDQTLELAPDHAAAYNARGVIHASEEDLDAAEEDFSAAILHSPEWAMPWLHRGNTHAARGEMRRAISDYDQAVRLLPELAMAFKNRGTARAELEDYDLALADLSEAVRLDPEFAEARFERAMLAYRQGDSAAALADLDELLRMDADNAPAYYWRANIRRAAGEQQEAMQDMDALIRLCPTSGSAYSARAGLWIEMGQPERASDDYAEAVRVEPASAEAFAIERLLTEAAYALNADDFDTAIARASEALEADPECVMAYKLRASAHWYSSQHVEAADDFTWMLDSGHDTPEVRSGRGQVYAEMNQFEEALEDLDRALANKSWSAPNVSRAYALSGRALALAGLDRFEESNRDFEESVSICPGNAWLFYNQGLVYHSRNEVREACVCFGLAVALNDPPLPPFKRQRAQQFLKLRSADSQTPAEPDSAPTTPESSD